jgi:hypothetical protein
MLGERLSTIVRRLHWTSATSVEDEQALDDRRIGDAIAHLFVDREVLQTGEVTGGVGRRKKDVRRVLEHDGRFRRAERPSGARANADYWEVVKEVEDGSPDAGPGGEGVASD